MESLKAQGTLVWLETELAVLEKRLARNSRHDRGVAAPEDMSLADIYAERMPLYAHYADIRIDFQGDTESVVLQILEAMGERS